jgi:hypothetical protein
MPRLVGKEDVGVVEPVSIRGESRVSDVLETEGDAVMGSRLELVLPLPSSNKAPVATPLTPRDTHRFSMTVNPGA